MLDNPFVKLKDKPQQLSWKHFVVGETYEFLILLPFEGVTTEWGKNGKYLSLVGYPTVSSPISGSDLVVGPIIIFDLPQRTFERAWLGVDYRLRKVMNGKSNLLLRFNKVSKRDIGILSCMVSTATSDEERLALDHYSSLKELYCGVKLLSAEEL